MSPVGVREDHAMLLLAGVRFLAEIAMLLALGWVGYRLGGGMLPLALLLAALLPTLAATTWGLWVAPRANHRLHDPRRLAVEVVLFGLTAAGLVLIGQWPLAGALGIMYAVSAPAGRAGL